MRICSPQLGLSPQSILGGEIYDRQILKYFALSGVEVEVLLPFTKSFESIPNLHITKIPIPFVIPPHLYNFLVLPQLLDVYNKKAFDILRIHSPTFLGITAKIFKKIYPQVPIIANYHWLGEGGAIGNWLEPKIISAFDAVICDSQKTKKDIENKYSSFSGKVYAVHNGVDEVLRPQPKSKILIKKLRIPKKATILLFMGLFIRRKNPTSLLSIMAKLLINNRNIHLLLCGNGAQKAELEYQIKMNNLQEYVKIIDPVYGEAKNDLFNIANIFVHPALNEGFSLSVIEAMACGLPILITRGFSAQEAITHGINGYLCSSENEWLKYLNLLINNQSLVRNIRHANLAKVKKQFRWNISGKKQLASFMSTLSNKKIERNHRSCISI